MIHIVPLAGSWQIQERLRSLRVSRRTRLWRAGPHVKSLEHDAGVILFDTRTGRVFSCNRTGLVVWQRLQEPCDEAEVVRCLTSQYGLHDDQVRGDVTAIVAAMACRRLIRRTGNEELSTRRLYLVIAAWFSLALYDLARLIKGFRGAIGVLGTQPDLAAAPDAQEVDRISTAVCLASRFYCRRVWCLQRSVAMVRMLRRRGIRCELVIGFRPAPLFGHAWVEIDGHVIGDSAAYKDRLKTLYRA